MEPNPLRTTLDTLRSEREGAERRASELDEELREVGQRLTHLRGAIENIEALLGVPSVEDEDVLSNIDEEDEPERSADPTTTPHDVEVSFGTFVPVARKRVPSTDWVAEVVNALGRPADRNTIYDKFEEMKGIPESWVSNPRNSLNNALGRAVERHMIIRVEGNKFAPRDWTPFDEPNKGEES
ncbi:hypothetical protein [Microbacterium sp.]|uniref:hypothetical protein n=1 Tax=Microbacterium sp. TaxID=51671 RepID=UPI003A8F8FC9